jgi:hypothetical protein
MADARPSVTGFRALLAVGALVSIVLGLWGLFFSGALHSALGFDVNRNAGGYLAMARLFGAAMLALGVGYALAAVHPQRNRGLLVVLFVLPLASSLALVIASARSEVSTPKGAVFAAVEIAYCLLYFRLYPRPVVAEEVAEPGPDTQPSPQSPSA